jgi:NAD(P)-dependent dehydrogenase (short-subunit alcohol dehydrogenase family)
MGKTILITGASSGIGEACTDVFAEKGWNVVATMRDPQKSRTFKNAQNVLVSRRRRMATIDCGTWWGTTHEASSEREPSCRTKNTSTSCEAISAMPLASHDLAVASVAAAQCVG